VDNFKDSEIWCDHSQHPIANGFIKYSETLKDLQTLSKNTSSSNRAHLCM